MTEERKKGEVEELREVLDVVSDRIPGLLRGLRDVLYSKDAAENMADAVATFYKKLVEAGIPKEDALDMARGYMINLRDILGRKGLGGIHLGEDFDVDEKEED
ncbi:MAG TPA: hypothetical protein ENL11_01345 [Candidatus Acetothermia bacterium]|nr:hypothetical protein [Candidatus Acetothermia bacterium]